MQGLSGYAAHMVHSGLSSGPSPERLRELTAKVQQMADMEMEGAQMAGPAVACRKGCAHCCYQWVTATVPEVLLLAQTIKATFRDEALASLTERIRIYVQDIASIPPLERMLRVRTACPLLKDDLCTAFGARPMSCRTFNAIDVQECIRYRNGESDAPGLANGRQMEIGQSLHFGAAVGLRRAQLQEALVEMVPALEIALTTDDAAERYLAGEPVFGSVIAAGYDPTVVARFAGGS